MGNILYSLLWLIILVVIGFWVALIASPIYVFCQAFAVCIEPLSNMGNILYSVIWLLILLIVGFWIAGIAAAIYIIVIPFTVCIEPLTSLADFLLQVVQFPRYCAKAMVEGRGF